MDYFDLHCDTIYECLRLGENLRHNRLAIDLCRGTAYDRWAQVFACWISDDLRGEEAYQDFLRQYHFFMQQFENNHNLMQAYGISEEKHCCQAMISVEGGAVLAGTLNHISDLAERGVKILTLCWNGRNEIASGALSEGGLTSFGRSCIPELERYGIVVDVSHLNDQSFWEVCEIAQKPLIATHSNARAVCRHPRNLTDEQILELKRRNGLIGLNFYIAFLSPVKRPGFQQLKAHIDHFLGLGCEDILAFGSDFDGATMPDFLSGIEDVAKLYRNMVKYYGQRLTDKLFYQNAQAFFQKIKEN